MPRKLKFYLVLASALFAFVSFTAYAQDDQPPGEHEGPRGKKRMSPEERRAMLEKLQTARAIKLQEHLSLSDAKLQKVDKILRRHDEKIFKTSQAHRQTRRRLKKAMRKGGSDAELEKLLAEAVEQRRRLDDLRVKQFEAASKPLNARQKVQLFQFLPQFERKARRHLMKKGKKKRRGRKGRRRDRR